MKDIELIRFPDFSGWLWYLDHINELKLMNVSGKIKALEWEHGVRRIKAPNIVECGEEEAQMTREHKSRDPEHWRRVRDLWKDSIEVAARHTLSTYKQLPYAMSAEDAIYYVSERGLEQKYVWLVAVYGGELGTLAEVGGLICENVKMRMEESAVKVRGADNKMFRPRVAIMEVTLIDGGVTENVAGVRGGSAWEHTGGPSEFSADPSHIDSSSPTGSAQETARTGEARPAPSQLGAAHG